LRTFLLVTLVADLERLDIPGMYCVLPIPDLAFALGLAENPVTLIGTCDGDTEFAMLLLFACFRLFALTVGGRICVPDSLVSDDEVVLLSLPN